MENEDKRQLTEEITEQITTKTKRKLKNCMLFGFAAAGLELFMAFVLYKVMPSEIAFPLILMLMALRVLQGMSIAGFIEE